MLWPFDPLSSHVVFIFTLLRLWKISMFWDCFFSITKRSCACCHHIFLLCWLLKGFRYVHFICHSHFYCENLSLIQNTRIMIFSTNEPRTFRLIVILFDITYFRFLSNCSLCFLKINLQTSLLSHTLQFVFVL